MIITGAWWIKHIDSGQKFEFHLGNEDFNPIEENGYCG